MSNFTDKKKDAFRIASRFIKELGLYDIWLKYLYDPNTSKSWLDKPDSKFFDSDILGCTTFTDYVNEHKPTFKTSGYLMYELLNSITKRKRLHCSIIVHYTIVNNHYIWR